MEYPSNEIIGPFKTELGWHLVKVYDYNETDITSNTERQQAKIEIAKSKTEIRFKDWLDSLVMISKIKYIESN